MEPQPPFSPENLEQVLPRLLDPQQVEAATAWLGAAQKHQQFVPLLCRNMLNNPSPEVRRLAAVLVRKRIGKGLSQFSNEDKEVLKVAVLERLKSEPDHGVRIALAHAVAAIARLLIGEWQTPLFNSLHQCIQSEDASLREAALVVMYSVVHGAGFQLKHYFRQFLGVFEKALGDPGSMRVRLSALRGIEALSQEAEGDDATQFRSVVRPIVGLVEDALRDDEEEVALLGLSLLEDLLENTKALDTDATMPCLRCCVTATADTAKSWDTRGKALEFVQAVARQKPKLFTKNPEILYEVLKILMACGIEDEGPDADEEDSMVPYKAASRCLDALSIYLPSKLFYPCVTNHLDPLVQSTDPFMKRAALLFLGAISEGCSDLMKKELPNVLPFVFRSFDDADARVRGAAGICLGHLSSYLQPNISKFYDKSLECLVTALRTKDEDVQQRVCYAIECTVENLEPKQVERFLPPLITELLNVLSACQSTPCREACLTAIASTAAASREYFEPFAKDLLAVLESLMSQTKPDLLSLRAKATLCAGNVASAMSKETFVQYRESLVGHVVLGMNSVDSNEVREASHRFFGHIVASCGDDFAPLLGVVVSFALASLESVDGLELQYEDDDTGVGPLGDDSDDEDEARVKGLSVRHGFLDEQEAALDLLRVIYANVKAQHTATYTRKVCEVLDKMSSHFQPSVRMLVPPALEVMLLSVHQMHPPDWMQQASSTTGAAIPDTGGVNAASAKGWIPGLPCQTLLHPETQLLWTRCVWKVLDYMLHEDQDKEVVGAVCSSLGTLFENLGPDLLQEILSTGVDPTKPLMEPIVKILESRHACQTFTDEDIDDDSDSRRLEETLFEGLSVLIAGVAQALGQQFGSSFEVLKTKLLRLAMHPASLGYRCIGIGCIADVFKAMGSIAASFVSEELYLCVLQAVRQSEDLDLRRNASFCLGILVQVGYSLPWMIESIIPILQAIYPVVTEGMRADVDHDDAELFVVDNAVATVARMILYFPDDRMPLLQVLPVFLGALPLKKDKDECEAVMQAIKKLAASPVIENFATDFLRAATLTVVDSENKQCEVLQTELSRILASLIRSLGAAHPNVEALSLAVSGDPAAQEFVRMSICG